jgi:uncharacterized protein YodC (DUF2158 family)
MNFKRGNRVQLRSGGAVMTVAWVHRDSQDNALVRCEWFVNVSPKHKMKSFPPESLELVRRRR